MAQPVTSTPTNVAFASTLARFVTDLEIEQIPEPVLQAAKEHALDALGIAVASSGMDFGTAVHAAAQKLGAAEQSRTIGFGTRMPESSAALVNGTLMHGLDFDDTHIAAIYHATAPALPAALAVGEGEDADGASLLTAFIVGLEVGCRLAAAGAGKFHARGFHPTGIAGTFAAACVSAKLKRLDADTLTSALGLCGSQAAGMLELHDSWLKRMHPGWAAHSGIIATTLAQAGFRGPATVFEGPGGLYRSHIEQVPTAEELGLADLGERWMTAEIAFKPYPCCHFIHASADAAFALLDALATSTLSADEVAGIECPISEGLLQLVAEPADRKTAPETIYDALFSVQYVVATALVTGRVDLGSFYDAGLDHPAVLAMAAKVRCVPDPASDFPVHFPGEVKLRLVDGRTCDRRVPASYGTPDNPMSAQDLREKFRTNAIRRLTAERADELATIIDGLEELPDLSPILASCVANGPAEAEPTRA